MRGVDKKNKKRTCYCDLIGFGVTTLAGSATLSETMNMNLPKLAPTADARHARLLALVASLDEGADARVGVGAIFRELEALHPGSLDQAAATDQARRLGIPPLGDMLASDTPGR